MARNGDDAPDKLIRESAGRYRTADSRFTVAGESGGSWYVTDGERLDELGLPRVSGPFAKLDDVRNAVAAMRAEASSPAIGRGKGSPGRRPGG